MILCMQRNTMRIGYDRITTTIEREWLAEIIAGTKKIEYRQDHSAGRYRLHLKKIGVPALGRAAAETQTVTACSSSPRLW
jgi:hypothetical protein